MAWQVRCTSASSVPDPSRWRFFWWVPIHGLLYLMHVQCTRLVSKYCLTIHPSPFPALSSLSLFCLKCLIMPCCSYTRCFCVALGASLYIYLCWSPVASLLLHFTNTLRSFWSRSASSLLLTLLRSLESPVWWVPFTAMCKLLTWFQSIA